MSNIPDDIKSEPEEVNANQHLGDGLDPADDASAEQADDDGTEQVDTPEMKTDGGA